MRSILVNLGAIPISQRYSKEEIDNGILLNNKVENFDTLEIQIEGLLQRDVILK